MRPAKEGRTLWLKQVSTGLVKQLASLGEDNCPGIVFSSDDTYIYFARKPASESSGALYRVPVLGGDAIRVLAGISGAPAISPDGRSFAFVRSTFGTHGEDSIVTTNIDGSNERVLVTYPAPGIHYNRVVWSEDGKSLVYPLQSQVMAIGANGSSPHPLPGPPWWEIDDIRVLPKCCGMVVVGQLNAASRRQLFMVSLPDGHVQAITHDLSNYKLVRINSDGSELLALQNVVVSSLQIVSPGHEAELRVLSPENQNEIGFGGLDWERSGKLLFTNEQGTLMESDEDGTALHSAAGNDTWISDPVASPAGDFLVAARRFHDNESAIWRFDQAHGGAKQLSEGRHDLQPSITPDGRWIVYSSVQDRQPVLKKVASDGGAAVKLTDYNADHPSISPDGRLIACYYVPRPNGTAAIAILPITGGPPMKVLPLPAGPAPWWLVWTPDGKTISFINTANGVDNIWKQPLAGGPAVPVTHFTAGKIFNFRWARNGRLLLARGSEAVDAILVRHAAPPVP